MDSVIDPESKVHVPYSFAFYAFKYCPIIVSASVAIATGLYYIDRINEE